MKMESGQRPPAVRGSMTALVTPFRNGEVDWACVDALVDRQIEGGTDWLVALGTTGESPTLSPAEREKLIDAVLARAHGRCPVMVGTGSSSTRETVDRTRQAAAAGADAVLVVAPCYNRPTQDGLFHHFAAVAEATDLPVVLYNVPARTGVDIDTDVVVRLRESRRNIVAIKDASGRLDRVTGLRSRCDIDVLSGDDSLTWPFLSLGAVGVISVIGNLDPALAKSLVTAAIEERMSDALRIHRKVYDLAIALGRFGPNPIPIKTAMAAAGLCRAEFRLPLCPLGEDARAAIERILRRQELLERVPA